MRTWSRNRCQNALNIHAKPGNIKEDDANNPFNHKQDFFLNNYSIMRNAIDKSFAEIKLKPLIISGQ